MAKMAPEKTELLVSLVDGFLARYGHGRTVVAVDGLDGAGKTRFADDLAAMFAKKGHSAFRASIDDFHRPRAERYRLGRDSPQGYYSDSYDYSTFRRILIEPFRLGGSAAFVTAAFDHRSDAPVAAKWRTGSQDSVLIIDGIFLNRPELRGLWDFSIWLDAPLKVREQRLAHRDGTGSIGKRYTGGAALYLADADPKSAATAVIDNTDFEVPKLRGA